MTTSEILQTFKEESERLNKVCRNGNISLERMQTMSIALIVGTMVHLIEKIKELESKQQ